MRDKVCVAHGLALGALRESVWGVKVSIGLALARQVLKQASGPPWDPQTERGERGGRGQLGSSISSSGEEHVEILVALKPTGRCFETLAVSPVPSPLPLEHLGTGRQTALVRRWGERERREGGRDREVEEESIRRQVRQPYRRAIP